MSPAFGEGDYERTSMLLRPARAIAHRSGVSHAQQGVIDLTLIEASLRSGDAPHASALATERSDRRHDNPLSQLFLRRSQALASTA